MASCSNASNVEIILRTVTMAAVVTLTAAVIAFPIAYFAARYARGGIKALFYLAVMMPLWSSYLVKVYAWKLILAKEGIITWVAGELHLGLAARRACWRLPVIGGPSLSFSYIGTFLVFVYIWLPYMILPIQAALERVPSNLIEAAADLGANPRQTFRTVILPLALARRHRRLDLHLLADARRLHHSADRRQFAAPSSARRSIRLQGTAGNIPLAAAFTVVPMVIMGIYLAVAKRLGAFDAL